VTPTTNHKEASLKVLHKRVQMGLLCGLMLAAKMEKKKITKEEQTYVQSTREATQAFVTIVNKKSMTKRTTLKQYKVWNSVSTKNQKNETKKVQLGQGSRRQRSKKIGVTKTILIIFFQKRKISYITNIYNKQKYIPHNNILVPFAKQHLFHQMQVKILRPLGPGTGIV
jgi:hypothetical protein